MELQEFENCKKFRERKFSADTLINSYFIFFRLFFVMESFSDKQSLFPVVTGRKPFRNFRDRNHSGMNPQHRSDSHSC